MSARVDLEMAEECFLKLSVLVQNTEQRILMCIYNKLYVMLNLKNEYKRNKSLNRAAF